MLPEDVKKIVKDTPCMSLAQAERMTRFIHEHRVRDVLELGFAHGVSTCYIAAALQERGGGSVTTLDQENSRQRVPKIEDLLAACAVDDLVTIYREPQSFTWRLMRMLEQGGPPRFDLVYLDGGHTWDVTGFAFFLVDRLVRPGGWLIFDDIDWTLARSKTLRDTPAVKKMPEDYRTTAQVRKVFELLVMPHPDYDSQLIQDHWGYARKRPPRGPISCLDLSSRWRAWDRSEISPRLKQLLNRGLARLRRR